MATQLSLYQGALRELGERKLASITEDRLPRHLLDDIWDAGAVDECLKAGQWKFAKRSVKLDYSTSVTPAFGYQYAFEVPTDHLRTTALTSDEYQNVPLTRYSREGSYWFADVDQIYVSYVSNGNSYGGDLATWPIDFVRFVEAYLAARIVNRLTQDKKEWGRVYALRDKLKRDALSTDSMEGPAAFPPMGTWTSSRYGRGTTSNERGNRGTLVG